MTESKMTEAQKKAQRNYNAKNREHRAYLRDRSSSRSFIRKRATREDLQELKHLIAEREALMDNKEKGVD